MNIQFQPLLPFRLLIVALPLLLLAMLVWRIVADRARTVARRTLSRVVIALCTLGAATLLAIALLNPLRVPDSPDVHPHLAVVVDLSDSVLRADGGWAKVQSIANAALLNGIDATSADIRIRSTGSVQSFRDAASTFADNELLTNLPSAFQRLTPAQAASGLGTNIAVGLEAALQRIDRAGGQGEVLLISDGNQTNGDAESAAQRLAQRGIPIYIVPITSGNPELAITAADLPRQVRAGTQTFVRGLLYNGGNQAVNATLSLSENPGAARDGLTVVGSVTTTQTIAPAQWARVREAIQFTGLGLQFADLTLSTSQTDYRRRLYTNVIQPPKVLAVGGDNRWIAMLPADVISVTQIIAEQIPSAFNFAAYDAVVISSVTAKEFSPGLLAALAQAVEKKGVGLMLLNGSHQNADEQTATVLASYIDTPLEDLLPVSVRPRPFQTAPAKRQVVILIDSSGSMTGARLAEAKRIAIHIVQDLLRPQDRLDLLSFTTGASHLIKDREMDPTGKNEAILRINSITAGGGTDPNQALSLISGRVLDECGLIFLSDGEFDAVRTRPECRATVFVIDHDSVPADAPVRALADPIPISVNYDPASVAIPYFQPVTRTKYFEVGDFIPVRTGEQVGKQQQLVIPDLPLHGSAVTYILPGSDRVAVRPKLTDPILAYRDYHAGYVGAFASEIPPEWVGNEAARRAVTEWILRLIPYAARDRYVFHVTDRGDGLDLQISLVTKSDRPLRVDRLDAQLEVDDSVLDVPLRPDALVSSLFHGVASVPRNAQSRWGVLVLSETGADALARPQRVPVLIPAAGSVSAALPGEAFTYGQNEPLLRRLAQISGGDYAPEPGTPFFRSQPAVRDSEVWWPWFVAAALILYLAAIATRRLDS